MSGTTRRITIAKAVWVLLAVSALAAFAGCSGQTTGASDITRQPDGTYSAKLNAIGSCDNGSPTTPCTAYTRWRKVGTSAWTNGPTVSVPSTVKDVHRSQTATGLAPNTQYEYQVCGKEFADKTVVCVGSDPTDTNSTEKFVTAAPGKKKPHPPAAGSGAQSTTSTPTVGESQGSNGSGGGGGTSPLVPIAIGVGAGALVLGGTWWASRRFHW